MTIRIRNRLIFALFISSIIFLLINISLLIVSLANGTFYINSISNLNKSFSLIRYNQICVILSLFFEQLFVIVVSIVVYRTFEKTQSSSIIYFCLFLFSFITDALRLWIPLLNISDTFSKLYMFLGNASLFSKLMYPIALLYTVLGASEDQRQNIEKKLVIIIFACVFFADFIPLNTTNTLPNFAVDYSFRKAIQFYSLITLTSAVVILFISNKKRLYNQITTAGFILLWFGKFFIYNSTNILRFVLAIIFLSTGAVLYLKELHNQYLWND